MTGKDQIVIHWRCTRGQVGNNVANVRANIASLSWDSRTRPVTRKPRLPSQRSGAQNRGFKFDFIKLQEIRQPPRHDGLAKLTLILHRAALQSGP
jgi:hypothetical protein